jgi:hypothetical protein
MHLVSRTVDVVLLLGILYPRLVINSRIAVDFVIARMANPSSAGHFAYNSLDFLFSVNPKRLTDWFLFFLRLWELMLLVQVGLFFWP